VEKALQVRAIVEAMGFQPVTVAVVEAAVQEDPEAMVPNLQAVPVDRVAPRKSPGERCSSPAAAEGLVIVDLTRRAVVAKAGVEPPEIRGNQEHPTQAAAVEADPGMG